MAPQLRSRPRSSPAMRMAILAGLVVAVRHFMAPAYSVGGSWEGSLADAKTLPKGLDHMSLDGLKYGEGDLKFTVADGRLHAAWAKGPVSISTTDAHEWQFNFTSDDGWLHSRGTGAEVHWEASRHHSMEHFGDVAVNMSSGGQLHVRLTPSPFEIAGVHFAGHACSEGSHGAHCRLEAQRQLQEGVDVKYAVENSAGVYDLKKLSHSAKIDALLGANKAAINVGYDGEDPSYDVRFTRDLEALVQDASEVSVGVNNDGVFGTFTADKDLGESLSAGYKLVGRMGLDANHSDPSFAQSLELKNALAKLMLSHAKGKPVKAVVDIAQGPATVHTAVAYDLDTKKPTYNVTLSGDLTDLAQGQLGSARVQVGVDSKGPYGDITASRDLGINNLVAEFASAGRKDALEHALKVSNKQMHARLVKHGSADPRLQLGYELEV